MKAQEGKLTAQGTKLLDSDRVLLDWYLWGGTRPAVHSYLKKRTVMEFTDVRVEVPVIPRRAEDGWFADERLTIEEAIEAYTRNTAWASFEEDVKGAIEPGKLADIAVFDTNLVEVAKSTPAALLEAKVLYTIAGGASGDQPTLYAKETSCR